VRVKLVLTSVLSLGLWCALIPAPASAQNPDTMTPEQSEAKAREILGQLVNALGGSAFMEVQERECIGRRANIGHSGELVGYVEFKDYWRYPDKHRIDYAKKGNIIDMYNGDEGWTLDRSGVSEEPVTAMADFQDSVKRNIDNLLRLHLHDKDVYPRYGGMDLVDMRQVDWVEFSDVEAERKQRLAVDRSSHLLVRSEITSVDPNFNQRTKETTIYTNYQRLGGVMTPLQISREHDGRRTYQVFYSSCQYNSGIPADFFTKASLEKRYAEVGNKKDKDTFRNSRE
jgi:outer membrane lipoprotein-sorting protein